MPDQPSQWTEPAGKLLAVRRPARGRLGHGLASRSADKVGSAVVAQVRSRVLAGFHPEIEWREAEGNPYKPDGAAWVGPQAVLEKLFMRLGSEWEGFTVTVRTLHDAGEHVVMEGRYTGL